jgi:FkbM family methyltransferase
MSHDDLDKMKWIKFEEGDLKGFYVYTTELFASTYKNGDTDKEMMSSIANSVPDGKVIFDVGAFIGTSSLVFSRMVGSKGRVIAFEPNKFNRVRFEKNVNKNKEFSKNIALFPYALSDSDRTVKMVLSDNIDNGYSSTSRLKGSHSTIHDESLPEGFEEVEVQALMLDNFVSIHGIVPDILKIDIEGAEYSLLLGALATIRKYHPQFYIELHSEYCALKCTELLVGEGYSMTVLHEEDDNRIMIRADYTGSDMQATNVVGAKALDGLFSEVKELRNSASALAKELGEKEQSIINMTDTNSTLLSRINELETTLARRSARGVYKRVVNRARGAVGLSRR